MIPRPLPLRFHRCAPLVAPERCPVVPRRLRHVAGFSEVNVARRGRVRRTKFQEARMMAAMVGVAAVGAVAVGIMAASAGESSPGTAAGETSPGTVSCPSVVDKLPLVPAAARAEVDRELAGLERQIQEANQRIVSSRGQGGPNLVQNAVLGPLKDKRSAALERIAIAIGRQGERPAGLEALAACTLSQDGSDQDNGNEGAANPDDSTGGDAAGGNNAEGDNGGSDNAGGSENAGGNDNAGGSENAGGNDDTGGNNGDGNNGAVPTVNCPSVADKLPTVPAGAQAQVDRELAGLETQIREANQRIVSTRGQGGPNFVQNAILGPLEDKRFATLQRIIQAIDRQGDRPAGMEALAACTLDN
ncbi:hypothetical protein [Plantactinospora sp. WMMB782]|uniref:hypothetical protein n=1 Tax=Plantactinospora sp. WMMB782 TaxID=3404121 RepID=UPI003B950083